MFGCFDVTISNERERGISIWSIYLYTENHANSHANPNVNHRRTHFQCFGDPYQFRLRSTQDPFQIPHDYADNVNITRQLGEDDVHDAEEALRRVPMDNADPVFSSQVWVFDVLDDLYDMQLFPDDDFAEAHAVLAFIHERLVIVDPGDGN